MARWTISFFLVTCTWCFKIAFIIETVPCKLENDHPRPHTPWPVSLTNVRSTRDANSEIDIWLLFCIVNSFRIDGPLLPLSSEILARTSTSVCICTTQNSVSIEREIVKSLLDWLQKKRCQISFLRISVKRIETLRATAERRKIAEIARMPKLKITYCLQQNYPDQLKKLWIKILVKKQKKRKKKYKHDRSEITKMRYRKHCTRTLIRQRIYERDYR